MFVSLMDMMWFSEHVAAADRWVVHSVHGRATPNSMFVRCDVCFVTAILWGSRDLCFCAKSTHEGGMRFVSWLQSYEGHVSCTLFLWKSTHMRVIWCLFRYWVWCDFGNLWPQLTEPWQSYPLIPCVWDVVFVSLLRWLGRDVECRRGKKKICVCVGEWVGVGWEIEVEAMCGDLTGPGG